MAQAYWSEKFSIIQITCQNNQYLLDLFLMLRYTLPSKTNLITNIFKSSSFNLAGLFSLLAISNKLFMNRDFLQVNNSLTQEMFEEAKIVFQNNGSNIELSPMPLSMLPTFLQLLKISIPESMMKDYIKTIEEVQALRMSFKQFTHYVARASLENQIEDQLRGLFNLIDRQETGTINAQDLWLFVKDLQGGSEMNEKQIDQLMKELDQKQMGFLNYEDFIYGLLPK